MSNSNFSSTWSLASPLTLLMQEEAHGDRQSQEVLLLTFTSDLGFLESFALGPAQAPGARVSIVADAAMSSLDPRAARRAGRSYLPGLALTRGAFHPKLVVIAGPQRATVAIGSGNVTMSGWQGNAELWTVLRAQVGQCPAVFAQLARWLRTLPNQVRVSELVPEALQRTARLLDAHLEAATEVTDPDLRIVSSLTAPILEQLPTGPVDELAVFAPFHDPGARALGQLVDRFDPGRLLVSWQPGGTELDGPAVAALVAKVGGEVRTDLERRYRHGKLIEWELDGKRWALTGSANLSGAALLSSVVDGGNVELGLITPIAETLLPARGPSEPAALSAKSFQIVAESKPTILLLGATLVEGGLKILLGRKVDSLATVEVSHASDPPEVWNPAGVVPAGVLDHTLTFTTVGGSRVRVVANPDTEPSEAPRRVSNEVPVVDPARVLTPPGRGRGYERKVDPPDLFEQRDLAERFYADMASLADRLTAQASAPGAAASAKNATVGSNASAELDWEEYLDRCASRYGTTLLRFALGLPATLGAADRLPDALPVSWIEEIDTREEAELEGDTADIEDTEQGVDGNQDVGTQIPDLSGRSEYERRRYRNWAGKLVDAATTLGLAERMLVTRLLLWTIAGGAWNRDDRAWVPVLVRAATLLADVKPPQSLEPQVGSLAAVALSVLRSVAPRYEHTEETLAFENAAESAAHLLIAASDEFIEEYRSLLTPAFGPAVSQAAIAELADDLVAEDPIDDAVWALLERGRDAHRHGDVLHVTNSAGNPVMTALAAVGAAEDAHAVGAWAGDTEKWGLVMWSAPDLFAIESRAGKTLWRHFTVPASLSPNVLPRTRSARRAARPARSAAQSDPGGSQLDGATRDYHARATEHLLVRRPARRARTCWTVPSPPARPTVSAASHPEPSAPVEGHTWCISRRRKIILRLGWQRGVSRSAGDESAQALGRRRVHVPDPAGGGR